MAVYSKLHNSQPQAALDQPMRETAVCFATRVAIASGHLEDIEHKTLVGFGPQLGIVTEQYNRIPDILLMFQRFPNAIAKAA